MRNRVPAKREEWALALELEFTPVSRKGRHDGRTPERRKAFVEALADTGSVTRAAAMVEAGHADRYTPCRAPEACPARSSVAGAAIPAGWSRAASRKSRTTVNFINFAGSGRSTGPFLV